MSDHRSHDDKNLLAAGGADDSGVIVRGLIIHQEDESRLSSSSPGGVNKRALDRRDLGDETLLAAQGSPGKKACNAVGSPSRSSDASGTHLSTSAIRRATRAGTSSTSPSQSTSSHCDEASHATSPSSRSSRQSPPKNPESPQNPDTAVPGGLRVASGSSSAASSPSTGPLSPGLTWIFRNLSCKGVLGSGASAVVLKGRNNFTGEYCAVKVMLNRKGSNNGGSLEGPQAEIHCSAAVVKHKLMLPMTTFYPATFKDLEAWMKKTYNGTRSIPEQVKLFMETASENAEQGLVIGHTSVCQGTFLDEDLDDSQLAAPLYVQFLIGIHFLHTSSLDIAHADLHSQNILIKKPVMQPDVNLQQEDLQGTGCALIQIIDFGSVHISPSMNTDPSNGVMLEHKEYLAKDLLDAATTMVRYYAGREVIETLSEAMEVIEHLTSWRESGLSFEDATESAKHDAPPAPASSSFSSSGGTADTDEVTKWEHLTEEQKTRCLLVWEKLPHILNNEDNGILWSLLAREPEPADKILNALCSRLDENSLEDRRILRFVDHMESSEGKATKSGRLELRLQESISALQKQNGELRKDVHDLQESVSWLVDEMKKIRASKD